MQGGRDEGGEASPMLRADFGGALPRKLGLCPSAENVRAESSAHKCQRP